jgi:hypothetical protein
MLVEKGLRIARSNTAISSNCSGQRLEEKVNPLLCFLMTLEIPITYYVLLMLMTKG